MMTLSLSDQEVDREWITGLYEKVVKVKADVAAILNFFSRSIPQIETDHLDAASVAPIGGMRQGGSAEQSWPGATTSDENCRGLRYSPICEASIRG
jgi:hypothetical protein